MLKNQIKFQVPKPRTPKREQPGQKFAAIHVPLERRRETALAFGNGMTKTPGPGDEFLQEILDSPEAREACFKGLNNNPNSSAEPSNGPCDNQKNEPEDGKDNIFSHVCKSTH